MNMAGEEPAGSTEGKTMNFSCLGLLKRSLSAKLISVFILFLFIFLIYTTLYLVFYQTQVRSGEVVKRGQVISAFLAELLDSDEAFENANALYQAMDAVIKQKDILAVSVYNREGLVLERQQAREKGSGRPVLTQSVIDRKAVMKRLAESRAPHHVAGNMVSEIFFPVLTRPANKISGNAADFPEQKEPAGFIHLKLKRYDPKNRTFIIFLKTFLVIAVFFVLGSVIIIFTVRNITRPLKRLTGVVNDLEQGKRSVPVPIHSEDEVGCLAAAFNRMSESIKKREHDLEKSHERLMLALEAANEVLWDLDVPSRVITLIPRCYPMGEHETCEIKRFRELIHPEDRDRVIRAGEECIRQKKKTYAHEFRMRARNGNYRWIMSRGKTVETDKDGNFLRVIGTHVDITDLKEAKKQIRELSRKIITAQEVERQRISRELHDRVAQTLSFLKIASQNLFDNGEKVSAGLKRKADDITKTLDACMQETRRISYDLRPPELDQLGLIKSVYKFCNDFSSSAEINTDIQIAGMNEIPLDAEMEINIYRIIQEALNNIRKHAQASRASVKLLGTFPDIIIRIKDNGKGFDAALGEAATLKQKKRMGLVNIQERVRLMNGRLCISSQKNMGTKIQILFPCKETNDVTN